MNTKIIFLVGLLLFGLGIGLSLNQERSSTKPVWVHEVVWSDKTDNTDEIEELLWTEISPYRTEYEIVNISSSDGGKRLRVIAAAKDSEYPDIYDFTYENDKLLLTGYLLEAIPPVYRNEAIGIALGNQEVAARAMGNPAVKRILPMTSEKFYAPKTLLSVTWEGTSALVDLEERKVAQIWKAGS